MKQYPISENEYAHIWEVRDRPNDYIYAVWLKRFAKQEDDSVSELEPFGAGIVEGPEYEEFKKLPKKKQQEIIETKITNRIKFL